MTDVMGGEMGEGFFSDKFGWIKDAAKEVAQLFKTEVMPEIPEDELEDLRMQAKKLDPKGALSNAGDFVSSEEGQDNGTDPRCGGARRWRGQEGHSRTAHARSLTR